MIEPTPFELTQKEQEENRARTERGVVPLADYEFLLNRLYMQHEALPREAPLTVTHAEEYLLKGAVGRTQAVAVVWTAAGYPAATVFGRRLVVEERGEATEAWAKCCELQTQLMRADRRLEECNALVAPLVELLTEAIKCFEADSDDTPYCIWCAGHRPSAQSDPIHDAACFISRGRSLLTGTVERQQALHSGV